MVNRFYIKCPSCGKIYQIKLQQDRNLFICNLPIVVECKDCGDVMEYKYSHKTGITPKPYSIEAPEDQTIKTTAVGYSATLPITEDVYLRDLDGIESIMFFSMFINILHTHFTDVEVQAFDTFITGIQDTILPYRSALASLYPIFKKGNANAYFKKMAHIFNEKTPTRNIAESEMPVHFADMVNCCKVNLSTPYYLSNVYEPYLEAMYNKVERLDLQALKTLKHSIDSVCLMSKWYKEDAYPYIAKMVAVIEKFMPSMIYMSAGELCPTKRGKLFLSTISLDEAIDFYTDGFEIFAHGLPIIVGLENYFNNGNVDIFNYPSAKGITSLEHFAKLPAGLVADKIADNADLLLYLSDSQQHKIRNAADHQGIDYDSMTVSVR